MAAPPLRRRGCFFGRAASSGNETQHCPPGPQPWLRPQQKGASIDPFCPSSSLRSSEEPSFPGRSPIHRASMVKMGRHRLRAHANPTRRKQCKRGFLSSNSESCRSTKSVMRPTRKWQRANSTQPMTISTSGLCLPAQPALFRSLPAKGNFRTAFRPSCSASPSSQMAGN